MRRVLLPGSVLSTTTEGPTNNRDLARSAFGCSAPGVVGSHPCLWGNRAQPGAQGPTCRRGRGSAGGLALTEALPLPGAIESHLFFNWERAAVFSFLQSKLDPWTTTNQLPCNNRRRQAPWE